MNKLLHVLLGLVLGVVFGFSFAEPRGTFDFGLQIQEDTLKTVCPKDRKVLYPSINVVTHWNDQSQAIYFSWQCTKIGSVGGSDTYRTERVLLQSWDGRKVK